MEYMLLGRTLAPRELPALGLAQACVPDALAHARDLARQIAIRPARACAHIKTLVRGLRGESPARRAGLERTYFCDCMIDDEAQPLMRDVGSGVRAIDQPPPPRADGG
jgi:enoyl-CoA hydratase/carnithine racemase